ncbi:MAG: endolytic transglycosylase MltG [Actinomycetota bacterium]|nr:endolytic transglycosylase MltG [Actinomycetota bacterium]MDP2288531.1 endolytic transglycosylase MltG [Actinomycetota bacterium]
MMSRRNRLVTLVVSVVAVLALIVVFVASGGGSDFSGPGTGKAVVIVVRGDSLSGIANTLVQAGVVASESAFLDAAQGNDKSQTIGPGRYTLLREMSGEGALALMLDPKSRADSRLVLPEGLRLQQSVQTTAQATGIATESLDESLKNSAALGLPAWAKGQPEGMLFPASYDLAGDESADDVVKMLFKRFNQESRELDLEARAAALQSDPYSIMVIASMIQAEGHPGDYTKVSRVIYNRLEAGMPLQLDSTVAYGLGITQLSLTGEQLKSDTPYNTYVNKGIPPTPINSPGSAAIMAALSPAPGKWLYFVTVNPDTGETRFARNYSKFLRDKAVLTEYLRTHG